MPVNYLILGLIQPLIKDQRPIPLGTGPAPIISSALKVILEQRHFCCHIPVGQSFFTSIMYLLQIPVCTEGALSTREEWYR